MKSIPLTLYNPLTNNIDERIRVEMITLDKKQQAILEYRKGTSIRKIARDININRKTVSNYVKSYENSVKELLASNSDADVKRLELMDDIVQKPKYKVENRSKFKITSELLTRIEYYLNENENKILIGMKKQQKKKIDIHKALIRDGFDISYSTVSNTINSILCKRSEAFIKQDYQFGAVCEFDWGEVKLFIKGQLKKFQIAVFTSARGNYRYARLFAKQNTECFMESHALFFEHIGGVYHSLVYDNMKVAVKKFVGPTEKEPTDAMLKLSIYYGFEFRFCNVRRGNEKGHVEKSVEYVRRKAFCDNSYFDSLEDANNHLGAYCEILNLEPKKYYANKTPLDILDEERTFLLVSKPMLDSARTSELRVDKYSTICINNSHYSVPDQYVNRLIFTKVYSQKILCYCDGNLIAEHERLLNGYEWTIKLEHYLKTLKRKPGALKSSTAMHQANPQIKIIFEIYYNKREKEFIELIQFMQEKNKGIKEVLSAIAIIERVSPTDISTEKIISICSRSADGFASPDKLKTLHHDSEIENNSRKMLRILCDLIPVSSENFDMEAVAI